VDGEAGHRGDLVLRHAVAGQDRRQGRVLL